MSDAAAPLPHDDRDLIELRDVTMRFRSQTVLNRVNLTIHKGETLCVIGESGCGKTVLLKQIGRAHV